MGNCTSEGSTQESSLVPSILGGTVDFVVTAFGRNLLRIRKILQGYSSKNLANPEWSKLPLLSLCFTVCSFDNGISVLGSCSVAPAGRDQIFLLRSELAQISRKQWNNMTETTNRECDAPRRHPKSKKVKTFQHALSQREGRAMNADECHQCMNSIG